MNMDCYKNTIFVLLVILNSIAICVKSAPSSDGEETNVGGLNGEKLMMIGKELKLPMLQMIGETIDNIEKKIDEKKCDPHQCSEWTMWSSCTARFGQFGSKFRTRQCNVNMTSCEIDSNSRTEKEFGICIIDKTCPNGYNLTKDNFCMKFYSDKIAIKDAAEQQCQKDGGHLVNIDSELKFDNVRRLLTGFSTNIGIWIDGHRKDVSSPWEYTYGSQKGFFKWDLREPSNDLCLAIHVTSTGVKWLALTCKRTFYSICEISKTM